MDPGPHFAFGAHEQHDFVATFGSSMPAHLAHWFLTREQFEPVSDEPGLFRLTEPERDGPRRTRQAVHDLRHHGYAVHADVPLDPAASASPSRPALRRELMERRDRIARAAAAHSPQRGPAPTTSAPTSRPMPPKPAYTPTVPLAASGSGRHR